METSKNFKKLPPDAQKVVQDAQEIMTNVLKRVESSAEKYCSAYVLADIAEELDAEVLDLVGWVLLEAIRIRQVTQKRLARLDGEYLIRFLKYHDTQYLKMLRDSINGELADRKII